MDDAKKLNANRVGSLMNCINELNIDMPLYMNNQNRAIKFDFENIDDEITKSVIKDILFFLLEENYFWVCEYGNNSPQTFHEKALLKENVDDISVIPYFSKIDPEDFEYPYNAIVCAYIKMSDFMLDSYIRYAMSSDFISNTIFLVDDIRKIAINIYDRRGMDIVAADKQILKKLYKSNSNYISEYYLDAIVSIIDV